jgi:hypothetical protein
MIPQLGYRSAYSMKEAMAFLDAMADSAPDS